MSKYKNMIDQKYGKLTVERFAGVDNNRNALWECKCDCGKIINVISPSLKSGNTRSCGCILRKHDSSYTRLYNIYRHMIWRCENPNADQYPYYGGKGVEICKEWREDFKAFKKWAYENGYNDNLSIDRIDPDKDYSPDNCQWISSSENIAKRHKQNKKDGLPTGIYKRFYGESIKYLAYSHVGGKTAYIGSFDTAKEAAKARNRQVA